MVFDTRKPNETGKSGKITFPDTRKRTIVVEGEEYPVGPEDIGLRTKPQGLIVRFDPATGVQTAAEASEFSVHTLLEPQNPTEITATATGDTTIDIDGTINTAGNDGVEIHMSTTQGGPYSLETTVDETAFPVEISGLTADTTYYFVLRSFLYDGAKIDASFSSEVSATTGAGAGAPSAVSPAPTISEISRTATTMTLEATWTDVADETSYEWWAAANDDSWNDGTSAAPNSLAADSTSVQFVATRQNSDHNGFFCIRACNASGCSVQVCNGFTVAGNLTAPSSLAATNPSGSDVDLDWTDMSGASVADLTAIERRLVGGTFSEIDTVAFGTTHYDDNALADGSYEYRVRHRDNDTGNTSPYSAIDSVGINSGGGGSDHPNEPAGFIAESDRSFDALEEDGWKNFSGGNFSIEQDLTAPESPNNVGRMRYPAGLTGGSAPGNAYRGYPASQELYFHFWLKLSPGYENHPTAALTKLIFVEDSQYCSGVGTPGFLVFNGDDTSRDAPVRLQFFQQGCGDQRSQSAGPNLYNNVGDSHVTRDVWTEVEVHMVMNTASNFDGEYHQWIDGVKTHEYTDIRFEDPFTGNGFDGLKWNPTWGGTSSSVETTFYSYIDHFYISLPGS